MLYFFCELAYIWEKPINGEQHCEIDDLDYSESTTKKTLNEEVLDRSIILLIKFQKTNKSAIANASSSAVFDADCTVDADNVADGDGDSHLDSNADNVADGDGDSHLDSNADNVADGDGDSHLDSNADNVADGDGARHEVDSDVEVDSVDGRSTTALGKSINGDSDSNVANVDLSLINFQNYDEIGRLIIDHLAELDNNSMASTQLTSNLISFVLYMFFDEFKTKKHNYKNDIMFAFLGKGKQLPGDNAIVFWNSYLSEYHAYFKYYVNHCKCIDSYFQFITTRIAHPILTRASMCSKKAPQKPPKTKAPP